MSRKTLFAPMYGVLLEMKKAIDAKGIGAYERVMKLNSAFSEMESKAFGSGGGLTDEEKPFDLARNNLLMALAQGMSEQKRAEFRAKAEYWLKRVKREVNTP